MGYDKNMIISNIKTEVVIKIENESERRTKKVYVDNATFHEKNILDYNDDNDINKLQERIKDFMVRKYERYYVKNERHENILYTKDFLRHNFH